MRDQTQQGKEGAYTVLVDSYLSYMWHELSQGYSREAFRLCANQKCQNIIVCNTETNNTKLFCGDTCRAQANNAKISEQNSRARKSYYVGNDVLTIYRDAFDEDYKDDDGGSLERFHRLKRWIDNDFSKTKKGQIAKQKGAGRIRTPTK